MHVNLECLDDAIAEVVALPYSLHVCACMCVNGAHVCYTCGGQRTALGSQFCPSTVWALGTKLKSSTLAASTFTHCHLPSHYHLLFYFK